MGLWVMDRDEVFNFFHKDGIFQGAVMTHIDDFNLARTEEFVQEIISKAEQDLTVSIVEKDKFGFTCLFCEGWISGRLIEKKIYKIRNEGILKDDW